jgi:hypothetical protein
VLALTKLDICCPLRVSCSKAALAPMSSSARLLTESDKDKQLDYPTDHELSRLLKKVITLT